MPAMSIAELVHHGEVVEIVCPGHGLQHHRILPGGNLP